MWSTDVDLGSMWNLLTLSEISGTLEREGLCHQWEFSSIFIPFSWIELIRWKCLGHIEGQESFKMWWDHLFKSVWNRSECWSGILDQLFFNFNKLWCWHTSDIWPTIGKRWYWTTLQIQIQISMLTTNVSYLYSWYCTLCICIVFVCFKGFHIVSTNLIDNV